MAYNPLLPFLYGASLIGGGDRLEGIIKPGEGPAVSYSPGATSYKRKRQDASVATKGYVKRQISKTQERKYDETAIAGTEIPYDNITPLVLTTPAQGDGIDERIGDSIKPKSIEVRGIIYNAASSSAMARFVVFQWFQDDTPTLEQIITPDGGAITANTVFKAQNREDHESFRVLFDSGPFHLGSNASTTDSSHRTFNFKIKKAMRLVRFTGGTTNGVNKLYAIHWSNAIDTANAVYATMNYLVNFTDAA